MILRFHDFMILLFNDVIISCFYYLIDEGREVR